MERIREYNLLEDKKVIIGINIAALPLFLLGILIFRGLSIQDSINLYPESLAQYFINALIFLACYFAVIIIHELIHGLFFKVFSETGKVTFGFKNGMAYATNPGSKYTWWQFLIIVLAPCVFISSVLFILYQFTWINTLFFIAMGSMHFAGCVGDLWYALLIMKYGNKYYEDTEVGISIWTKD
ncbi:DUF3267 domain-containing protein [Fundicoccus ignavus]|uniref:DUF3267 domain-containing protein n=1 Tax=Fundicoccus ignavus TaxID=2664442 RepID=UPI0015620757